MKKIVALLLTVVFSTTANWSLAQSQQDEKKKRKSAAPIVKRVIVTERFPKSSLPKELVSPIRSVHVVPENRPWVLALHTLTALAACSTTGNYIPPVVFDNPLFVTDTTRSGVTQTFLERADHDYRIAGHAGWDDFDGFFYSGFPRPAEFYPFSLAYTFNTSDDRDALRFSILNGIDADKAVAAKFFPTFIGDFAGAYTIVYPDALSSSAFLPTSWLLLIADEPDRVAIQDSLNLDTTVDESLNAKVVGDGSSSGLLDLVIPVAPPDHYPQNIFWQAGNFDTFPEVMAWIDANYGTTIDELVLQRNIKVSFDHFTNTWDFFYPTPATSLASRLNVPPQSMSAAVAKNTRPAGFKDLEGINRGSGKVLPRQTDRADILRASAGDATIVGSRLKLDKNGKPVKPLQNPAYVNTKVNARVLTNWDAVLAELGVNPNQARFERRTLQVKAVVKQADGSEKQVTISLTPRAPREVGLPQRAKKEGIRYLPSKRPQKAL